MELKHHVDSPFKSDYVDWRRNQVTKFLVQELFNKREMLKEGIAEGKTSSLDELHQNIGRTQAIKDIIDYIISDFETLDDPQEETK